MKKIILSAAFLAFAGLATVKASEIKTPVILVQDSTTKTPVKLDQLPDAVQTTLKSDKYKDWTPSTAFLITAANKTEWYQVNFTNKEGQAASLNIGKDGVVVQ